MIEIRPAKYLLGRLAPMDNNDKIPQFNLGAGTYNSTVFLRGDGVWADPLAAGFVPYTGATGNVNLGEYGLSAGWLQIDTTPTTYTPGVGKLGWSDADGTLEFKLTGGNVTLQIGQEQVTRVVNKTDPLIDLLEANYQVVKVGGAQGNRLKVELAQANNDANSAQTLGVVTETILANQEGFITTSGILHNINTTGSIQGETWVDGDMLFLSGTIAGQMTKVKPSAPIHTVIIGYVIRAHATQGQIYVKIDNGYELGELHDVNTTVSKTTPVDADSVLLQDTADSNIWKKLSWLNTKATLKTYFDTLYQAIGNYVPTSRTITINSTTQDLSANRTYNVGTVMSVNVIDGPRIISTGGPITSSGEITISHEIGQGLDVQQAQDLMNRTGVDGGSFEALRCLSTTLGELGDLPTPLGTSNSGSSVIQNIMLDEFGHIVGLGSKEVNPSIYDNGTSVGIGTSAPHPSAILDLTSTTQGFLPPRMSDSEISSIASPRAGLIVWSTDSEVLNVFDGASWRRIAYA